MHFPYIAIISFSALSESDSAVSVSAGASEVDPSHSKRSVEADTDIDVKRHPKIIRNKVTMLSCVAPELKKKNTPYCSFLGLKRYEKSDIIN